MREAITQLDLEVDVYPCPKDSRIHRGIVESLGGKLQFPFLVDPNTGVQLYESDAIVKYLYKEYGGGARPPFGLLESTPFTGASFPPPTPPFVAAVWLLSPCLGLIPTELSHRLFANAAGYMADLWDLAKESDKGRQFRCVS